MTGRAGMMEILARILIGLVIVVCFIAFVAAMQRWPIVGLSAFAAGVIGLCYLVGSVWRL